MLVCFCVGLFVCVEEMDRVLKQMMGGNLEGEKKVWLCVFALVCLCLCRGNGQSEVVRE